MQYIFRGVAIPFVLVSFDDVLRAMLKAIGSGTSRNKGQAHYADVGVTARLHIMFSWSHTI
jgi:hypothetical protein